MPDNTDKLKGLRGLNSLSKEERETWYKLNEDKLKGKSSRQAAILYDNQKFINRFGEKAFNSYNKNQRDEIYKTVLANEAYESAYSPYTNKKDKLGNYVVDPNKGIGNADLYEKYKYLDADSKIELLKSGYKPFYQIKSENEALQKQHKEILNSKTAFLGAPWYAKSSMEQSFKEGEKSNLEGEIAHNNKILEKIWADDLKRKEKRLQPLIDNYYLDNISQYNDSEINKAFMKSITQDIDKGNLGNSAFKAFFHDGKKVEEEVKNFSIDDKRRYLAREKILKDYLGEQAANDALTNYAKEYISDNQSKWTYAGLLAKDIGISALTYSADKINSLRQDFIDPFKDDSEVWVDNKGNVISPSKIKKDKNNINYYVNDEGKALEVKKTKMSAQTLDLLGKDSDGNDRWGLFNNQYISDIEQYGTFDEDEIKQYKKLGVSPYKVMYKPGDERDLLYETIKMNSFALADVASTYIPVLGQTAGLAMQTAKATNMFLKASNIVGKGLYYSSKALQYAQPTIGATAIGHAYGRGVFSETLAQNLQKLEESTYEQSKKDFLNNYNNDSNFKSKVDKDILIEFNKLKKQQERQLANSEGNSKIVDQRLNDEMLMAKARENVSLSYVDKNVKDIQSSDKYFKAVGDVSEIAGDAAMTASITDAAKYALVNNFGYRKYLFSTPTDRAASALNKMSKNVVENGKRLAFKSSLQGADKAKALGKIATSQFIGGAWTNFTDEMQSWGGKQINEDRLSQYLNNFREGKATETIYSAMDYVDSYMHGATKSLGMESTWIAGLVGGLGSIGNFAPASSIIDVLATKEGRNKFKNATKNNNYGEAANMLIANGILNEYYAKKQAEEDIKTNVDKINKLLDDNKDFEILKKAVALDMYNADVTNQEDKDVLTYLKGLKSISLLHQFQNDEGIADQSSSKLSRWWQKHFSNQEESLINAIAGQSSILTKALTEIEKLAKSELTEEEAEEYLKEYYAKNPNVEQSAENNEEALYNISNNAAQLLNAEKTWQDINSKLDKVAEERGEAINQGVRDILLERAALDPYLEDKINKLESKITGTSYNPYKTTVTESFVTTEALKKQVTSLESTIRNYNNQKEKAKKEADKANEELESFFENHKDKDSNIPSEFKQAYSDLYSKKVQADYHLKFLEETLSKLEIKTDDLKDRLENPSDRVLTSDEILNSLDAVSRARMLDESNRSNYSKEQLEQIDALRNQLNLKNPSLLQSIQDQAQLVKHREANSRVYSEILSNPEVAAFEVESQNLADYEAALDMKNRRMAERINGVIKDILNNVDTNFNEAEKSLFNSEISKSIYKNLRVFNPKILDYLMRILPNEEGLEYIPRFTAEIQEAKKWSNMVLNISQAVSEMNLDKGTDKIFRDNIDKLIDKATSTEEAMNILNDVANSTTVSKEDRDRFKQLISIIDGVDNLKKSTTIETNKEKEERKETQQEQAKQEKNKIQEVEESVEKQAKDKKESITSAIEVTEKEQSNEANAQEAYIESEQEKSNSENGIPAIEVSQKEAESDKFMEEHKDEMELTDDVDLELESPSIDKQAKENDNANLIEITPDVTDQGNKIAITSDNLLGNAMYGFEVKSLEEEAKEVKRTGIDPNDKMSRFFNWLKNEGINLQDIIDNELKEIIKVNNKLEVLFVNPQANATDDAALNDFSFLCVEYTDKVKKIHKEDRGGVITANGKQYLMVGTMGFDRTNRPQGDTYRHILYEGKKRRFQYFNANPSERFYVDSIHTEVEQMTSGRIVRELAEDTGTQIRSVLDLLNDKKRNPEGLQLEDLKWGIQYENKFVTVGISDRNTVYPPRDAASNKGAVFLLIESANGNYIPASIIPTLLSDINDGVLKTQLNNLFNELTSINHADRDKAIRQLVKLLNLSKDGDNILIGTEDNAIVSTTKNGVVLRTFNLKDLNFNRMDLINAVFELNPRINITTSALGNTTQLRMFNEAGALNTDIAKLGTSNASYTVYSIGEDGNPIKTKPIENNTPSLEANSDLEKADYKKKNSVYHNNIQYRKRNDKWYDINWNEITDPALLFQIKWKSYIRANDLTPDLIANDKYKNKNVKYYVINNTDAEAKVVKLLPNGTISELSTSDSRAIIAEINRRNLQKSKEEAAKKEKERLERQEEFTSKANPEDATLEEEIDLDESLSENQIIAQSTEDFNSSPKPEVSDVQLRAQAIVDKITTDTHDIILDAKKGVYVDSMGKEYARVTNVIQATEGTERFDLNSPWLTPSTNIGTGIDNFVRDFFANKLGNIDTLYERYPNAGGFQLQKFLHQLEELKGKFDKAGLTVVPRDITVTGEVEVTDSKGNKYKLPVAGTLDLLAYDKQGNFYIFDMKTNRSAPNEKKAFKWNKQLSLYKQFLEQKYGIKVVETSIIPIEVSYPVPKGWGNGTTAYRADEKTNQLYIQEDLGKSGMSKEQKFMEANPVLHSNISIKTTPVKIEFNLLEEAERNLLSPVSNNTFNHSTGTVSSKPKNSNENINKTGNKSLAELQIESNAIPTDINSILKDRRYSKRIREVLKEKGFKGKLSDVESWLKENNMPISNINDIEAWLDILQNCR